jgi:hypothetical protein
VAEANTVPTTCTAIPLMLNCVTGLQLWESAPDPQVPIVTVEPSGSRLTLVLPRKGLSCKQVNALSVVGRVLDSGWR